MDVRDYLSNESNVNELNLYVENGFLNNCNNELNNSTKENVPSYLQRQKKIKLLHILAFVFIFGCVDESREN